MKQRWLAGAVSGGRIGLLDYGQSKQLPDDSRLAFAELVLALRSGDNPRISAAMYGLGVITEKGAEATRCKMAYGMFDTRGRCAISSGPKSIPRLQFPNLLASFFPLDHLPLDISDVSSSHVCYMSWMLLWP